MDSRHSSRAQIGKELRIVMLGKTGDGKSTTGNTILGRLCFKSMFGAKSMTVHCLKGEAVVDGQQVAVIDTPGLFDTRFDQDTTSKDISQCIKLAVPGPHVFLIVIKLGRYTEEAKQAVQRLQELFGQDADRYSMVLFTHGDFLEGTIEEFLKRSAQLQELVSRCNGEYHVFNNKLQDHSQVTQLFKKIRMIVAKNGGSHYTNEMFQEAERKIEEEKQQILRQQEENRMRKQREMERKLQEQHEMELKRIQDQLREDQKRERQAREEERRQRVIQETRERAEREAEQQREKKQRLRETAQMEQRLREVYYRKLEKEKERQRRCQESMAVMWCSAQQELQRAQAKRERERLAREAQRRIEMEQREAERQREQEQSLREIAQMEQRLREEKDRKLREEQEEAAARFQAQQNADPCIIL